MDKPNGIKNVGKIDIKIRFYEELNDFLKDCHAKRDIEHAYCGKRSVKDLIESFGVPHVEVDLILINGESVGFDRIVEDGDRISVYPVFERLNVGGLSNLRERPLRDVKFMIDVHLGKLARNLRLLGFDVKYSNDLDDDKIVEISNSESRIILTFDRQMLMRNAVQRGLVVRSRDPFSQVVEVLNRMDLWDAIETFSRCTVCNGKIYEIAGREQYEKAFEELPPRVRSWCDEIYRCDGCGRTYWKGSHYGNMEDFIDGILQEKPV